jgi:putative flippase GtrA
LVITEPKLSELDVPPKPCAPSRHRDVLKQFVKFCLVGAVSTAINVKLFSVLMAQGLDVNLSHVCAFTIAVTNGFFLNRAWTFRNSRSRGMERQYAMFVAVNIVGLALSWMVMRLVGAWLIHWDASHSWLLQSDLSHRLAGLLNARTGEGVNADQLAHSLGELSATPLCAVWNFTANKLWTFSGKK